MGPTVTTIITTPGIYAGMPDEIYHGDPVPSGSLSSSGARWMLSSPAIFRYRQTHRKESKEFDIGHAVHAKVLGEGIKIAQIPDELLATNGAASTKAAKAFIDEARRNGLVPLKRTEFYPVDKMAEAILAHPTAVLLLERGGIPEASIFATDPITGEWMRARPDFLPDNRAGEETICVDIKTAESAHPGAFSRSAAKWGYHQQAPWYLDTLTEVRGDMSPRMQFVIVEKTEPWLVSVCELDDDAIQKGRERNRLALDLWHQCRETGLWPGYGDEVHQIRLPIWALMDGIEPDEDVELKL